MVKTVLTLIKIYQKLNIFKYQSCRFYPSCSRYSYFVFKKYGFFRGLLLTIQRILRCNPMNHGGIDLPCDVHLENYLSSLGEV